MGDSQKVTPGSVHVQKHNGFFDPLPPASLALLRESACWSVRWHQRTLVLRESHTQCSCLDVFVFPLAQSKICAPVTSLFIVDISGKGPPAIFAELELVNIVSVTFLAPETQSTPC